MGVMDMEIDKLVNEVDDMEVGDAYDALHWGTKFSIQILAFIEPLQKWLLPGRDAGLQDLPSSVSCLNGDFYWQNIYRWWIFGGFFSQEGFAQRRETHVSIASWKQ